MNMQAMQVMDEFRLAKRQLHQGQITYEQAKELAIKVLQTHQAAELKLTGKVKTKITQKAISSLLR